MSYAFHQSGWAYTAPDWEQAAVMCAIREGRLEAMLRANPKWLKVLGKMSRRMYAVWSSIFDAEEERSRLLSLDRNQPTQPDCAYEEILQ